MEVTRYIIRHRNGKYQLSGRNFFYEVDTIQNATIYSSVEHIKKDLDGYCTKVGYDILPVKVILEE